MQELERQSANAHLYFLDADRSIPVVLFTKTDLSEAKDLDSALTVMRKDGHLTIMYQAQIHGNEPASGEGRWLWRKFSPRMRSIWRSWMLH